MKFKSSFVSYFLGLVKSITEHGPLAQKLPQAHFGLALNLAQDHLQAAEAAAQEPDPECTWPIEMLERLNTMSSEE